MKLGLIAPVPQDSTSFYRAYGVFAPIARQIDTLQLVLYDKWDWTTVMMCDLVVMQRPWVEAHKIVAEIAKRCNVPVWMDYDDNLFNVHRANPAYATFMNKDAQANLRRLADLATVTTVTTGALASLYKNSLVIPNAFNDYIFDFTIGPRNKVITWRGGVSHYGDMEPFLPAIKEVAQSNPGWFWHFMGDPHWAVEQIIPADQLVRHGFSDIFHYNHMFSHIKPAIHIVPLHESSFNFCKSNLAWLEATGAGAVTLGPDWPEWRRPGIVNYKNPDDFKKKLDMLIAMPEAERDLLVTASREYIQQNLLLSVVNKRRVEILEKLYRREPVV